MRVFTKFPVTLLLLFSFWLLSGASAQASEVDGVIDRALKPIADVWELIIFYSLPMGQYSVPLVLILLAGSAILLTIYFRFVNLRMLPLALKTVTGRYTDKEAPGEITHFQALTAALSATVGLGNIAGVAVAIGLGGPGATFWMILLGFCGMATKFAECTLGVKYRHIDNKGKAHGGPMFYLRKGLADRGNGSPGWVLAGKILAVFFALMAIGGAIGAGNMYQANQAHSLFSENFGILKEGWQFGLFLAFFVGLVIIGGIKWIARVTEVLVPFMCVIYLSAGFIILFMNIELIGPAIGSIVRGAFTPDSLVGGFIGVLIQGIQRAAFSNEAGVGSAPIAHSAVKTNHPASEGLVALLEPLTDTVIVCTMTALVLVVSGTWKVDGIVREGQTIALYADASGQPGDQVMRVMEEGATLRLQEVYPDTGEASHRKAVDLSDRQIGWVPYDYESRTSNLELVEGIRKTARAFGSQISWFPNVLAVSVLLFAFSTMISWSYYGEQGLIYLIGRREPIVVLIYKLGFCVCVVIGAASSLTNVLRLGDAMLFSMVIPNLLGLALLLPIIKQELSKFIDHAKKVDSGEIKIKK